MASSKVTLTIDGRTIETVAGRNILDVALENGIDIPHFCYHPRLMVAGNCRMCLVEIEKAPKLQISCGTPVRDGMVVHTTSEKVLKAREAIMEFLLINHPLDCPVCDQCGECTLQDHSFEHGRASSRYHEDKRTYFKKNLGPLIEPEMNRCIHCTRCIRFLRDVAGSEEMTLSHRGEHTEVGSYLGKDITSPFSMNVIDLCPVGALTSKHFRFKGRGWMMEKTRTVCTGCARGCNIIAWSFRGKVYRYTAAENPDVNLSWLCDAGRLTVDEVHAPSRIMVSRYQGKEKPTVEMVDMLAAHLKKAKDEGKQAGVGFVVSAKATNEDLFLIKRLAHEVIGTKQIFGRLPQPESKPFGPIEWEPLTKWFIRDDKTPNSRGMRDIFGDHGIHDVKALTQAIHDGKIHTLLVFGGALQAAELKGVCSHVAGLVVIDTHTSELSSAAHMLIAETYLGEREGTLTNEGCRVQKLSPSVPAQAETIAPWELSQMLAERLGSSWAYASVAEVFAGLAKTHENYTNLTFHEIGPEGAMTIHR